MKVKSTIPMGGGAIMLVATLLVGCAGAGKPVISGNKEAVTPMAPATPQEAVAVIYRKADPSAVPALILVNDQVVGSLRPGAYTQARVCPGDRIGVVPATGKPGTVQAYQTVGATAGETVYLDVSQAAAGGLNANRVEPTKARQELSGEWTQSYLVSRYVPQCAPVKVAQPAPAPVVVAPPPPPPVVLERVQLQADALFVFGRSGLDDIHAGGRKALDDLARNIRDKGVKVERLRIVGHADRLGKSASNQQLSLARALTVQQYLQQGGLRIAMDTQGRGSAEPVTRDCKGSKASPQLVACLQPDRRVEVELLGQAERASTR